MQINHTNQKKFPYRIYAVVSNDLGKEIEKNTKNISISAIIRIALTEYFEKNKVAPISRKAQLSKGGQIVFS